jgi:hypothetical protein
MPDISQLKCPNCGLLSDFKILAVQFRTPVTSGGQAINAAA